jgi:hypothetical protein
MKKNSTNKILGGQQCPPLINFDALVPKFESELQREEYEQALLDVHLCKDRRTLIHSKKGAKIVLLYMKVWQIGPQQAIRELVTDGLYASSIARALRGAD